MDEEASKHGAKGLLTKENLKTFLIINAGVFLLSLGVYFFKFPNNFTTGGVSGLSIILGRLIPMPWLSPATMMWIINMALLAIGFIFLGRGFGVWTAYCSLAFSAETWLMEKFFPMESPFTHQPLLELCFAIMLPAVGSALLFNSGASSGGTDIVAMILKKYTGLDDIGKALFVSDGLIALSSCWLFGMETGLFSLLGLFLKAFVVDSVIESINLCKFFSIVTAKPDEICDFIIKDLNRSCTVVDAIGAYSHEGRKVVLIACRRGEAVHLRQRCKQVDPQCFMFITNTSEIIGKGFRSV
ncbi:YitT family protein [Acutalibacter muris]|nr:YitT family protein [Acutalibacter muris]QQR29338.1 YitT family protein [Acutalibacter muris]